MCFPPDATRPTHTSPRPPADSVDSVSRRRLLSRVLTGSTATLAAAGAASLGMALPGPVFASVLTEAERDALTPADVLARLLEGNARFRGARPLRHDYVGQTEATRAAQHPTAIILSCIDSRVPAEIVTDAGIGELFNARVAGNISNDDTLGSLEFACAAAGAKLILVVGHTGCGAIKGAIDSAQLGHLTGLVDRIKPAVEATVHGGPRTAAHPGFVDAVARTNVRMTVQQIRNSSAVLAALEREGRIAIVGALYHLDGGRLEVLDGWRPS